jgi:thioredoxin 1
MASDLIKHVSDTTFEADVLKSAQPVLVDYWAEWCGPCKMIAPILDEVATTYTGKLQIAKMNVDENREIPAKFGIRGIPHADVVQGWPTGGHQGRRAEQGPARGLHRPATGLIHRQARWARTEQRGPSFPPFFSCHNPA